MNQNSIDCPVPKEQIPCEEYKALSESWFFSWALNRNNKLYKNLSYSWIIFFPITLIVSNGSYILKNDPLKLAHYSIVFSLIAPITLLIRQLLSWNYILKRLLSDQIEYEESGWYDGQIWEKPMSYKEKDMLIAKYEVQPIIDLLNRATKFALYLILLSIFSLLILN